MKAYQFLKDHGFCQGSLALDAFGKETYIGSSMACSFCMEGAIWRAYDNIYERRDAFVKVNTLLGQLGFGTIPAFNDRHTKDECLTILLRAGV